MILSTITSTIQKYLLYILLLACAAGAGFTAWYHHKASSLTLTAKQLTEQLATARKDLATANKALTIAQGNLDATTKALKSREASLAKLKKEKDRNDVALKKALRENPDWSNAPLPDGVLESVLGSGAASGELPGNPPTH